MTDATTLPLDALYRAVFAAWRAEPPGDVKQQLMTAKNALATAVRDAKKKEAKK